MFNALQLEFEKSLERRTALGFDEAKTEGARLGAVQTLYNSLSTKIAPKYLLKGAVEMAELVGVCGDLEQFDMFEKEFSKHIGVVFEDTSVVAKRLAEGLENGKKYILKPATDSALGIGVVILSPSRNNSIDVNCLPFDFNTITNEPAYDPWHVLLEDKKNYRYFGNGYNSYNVDPIHLETLLNTYSTRKYPKPYLIAEEYIPDRILTPEGNVIEMRYQFDARYGFVRTDLNPLLIKIGANKYFGTITFLQKLGANSIRGESNIRNFAEKNLIGLNQEDLNEKVKRIVETYFEFIDGIGFLNQKDIMNFSFDFCFVKKQDKIVPIFIENHVSRRTDFESEL